MMLDHLGEPKAARAVEQAILRVLANSFVRTRDIGGNASTREIGEAIAAEVGAAVPTRPRIP
jgi:tartrate dehydrogenase/decarboxylase / D-malate dehydrogenase